MTLGEMIKAYKGKAHYFRQHLRTLYRKVDIDKADADNTLRIHATSDTKTKILLRWYTAIEMTLLEKPLPFIYIGYWESGFEDCIQEHSIVMTEKPLHSMTDPKPMEAFTKVLQNDDEDIVDITEDKDHIVLQVSTKMQNIISMAKVKLMQLQLYFKDDARYEEYKKLLNAIAETNPEKIDACFEMVNKAIRKQSYYALDEVFQINGKAEIERLQMKIHNLEVSLSDLHNKIARNASDMRETKQKLKIMESMPRTDNTLFLKYLMDHPYITDVSKYTDNTVLLDYFAPLKYFNEDYVNELLDRNTYNKRILRAFKDKKYELWTKCSIIFNTSTFTVESNTITTSNDEPIAHPHINRYSCFGDHRASIEDSATSGDYFGAIEQITQAVLNLNFYDDIVITELICTLTIRDESKTWRNKETGEFITTKEIEEIYKED